MKLIPSTVEERIAAAIDDKGYAVVTIPGEADDPAFAYTVGLAANGRLPELILCGLSRDVSETILTHAADVMRKLGPFRDGQQSDTFLHEVSCKFRSVEPDAKAEYLRIATVWHGSRDYGALQMIWPDKFGVFPDEQGFAAAMRSRQPHLWRPGRLM